MGENQWFLTFSNLLGYLTTDLSRGLDIATSEEYLQDKREKLKEFAQYLEKGEEIPEELYTELDKINERLENYELIKTGFQELKIPLTGWSPDSYIIKEGEN